MDQRNENDSIIPPDSGKWVDCLLLIMRYDCHIHDGSHRYWPEEVIGPDVYILVHVGTFLRLLLQSLQPSLLFLFFLSLFLFLLLLQLKLLLQFLCGLPRSGLSGHSSLPCDILIHIHYGDLGLAEVELVEAAAILPKHTRSTLMKRFKAWHDMT